MAGGLLCRSVGAVGQHAPEDLPNVYKQRGTWALDTMRLLIWGDLRGLHSCASGCSSRSSALFYLQSFATHRLRRLLR